MDDLPRGEYVVPTYEMLESSSVPSPCRPKGAGRRSVSRLSGNSFSQLAAQVRRTPLRLPRAAQLGVSRVGGSPLPRVSQSFSSRCFAHVDLSTCRLPALRDNRGVRRLLGGRERRVDVAACGLRGGAPDIRVILRGLMHDDDCTVQADTLS
jgi:hypothetical protein